MSDQDRTAIDEMLNEARKDLGGEEVAGQQEQEAKRSKLSKLFRGCRTHKRLAGSFGILLLLGILAVIPFTRYKLAGLFVSRDITVYVVDSQTNQAVSGAEVVLQGKTVKTDGSGRAIFYALKPGRSETRVIKKYYQDSSAVTTIGLRPMTYDQTVRATATGRQVPVRITNKITGKGLGGVTVQAGDAEAETNHDGEATIVVDASATTLKAQLTAEQYNQTQVNITVSQEVTANSFTMTPIGKLYFLSKKSGNIDVVKTDLDGAHRSVVLAGTGNEENSNTVLLASADWKFLALLARREGSRAVLYLIDTSSDKLTQIDSENANMTLTGWSGHTLVYTSQSEILNDWQSGQTKLKRFNADTGTHDDVDQTAATGSSFDNYMTENFSDIYFVGEEIVYAKNWVGIHEDIDKKRSGIYAVSVNQSEKKRLKDFSSSYLTLIKARPLELYIQQTNTINGESNFFSYGSGVLTDNSHITPAKFTQYHSLYVTSPTGQKTLWAEQHGSKQTLSVGDKNGSNGSEILNADQYLPYGWYSDEYILVSRSGSELYIGAAGALQGKGTVLQKVTDYHRPVLGISGYGGY